MAADTYSCLSLQSYKKPVIGIIEVYAKQLVKINTNNEVNVRPPSLPVEPRHFILSPEDGSSVLKSSSVGVLHLSSACAAGAFYSMARYVTVQFLSKVVLHRQFAYGASNDSLSSNLTHWRKIVAATGLTVSAFKFGCSGDPARLFMTRSGYVVHFRVPWNMALTLISDK
jgi:hypothetical protein